MLRAPSMFRPAPKFKYSSPIPPLMTDNTHTDARAGDRIRLRDRHGRTFEGILMPHHAFSGEGIVVVKMDSGYNIGVRPAPDSEIEILERGDTSSGIHSSKSHVATVGNKPSISIISTGGTIASFVDYKTGAVHPAMTADDFVRAVPELSAAFNVRTRVPFSILSEDMSPKHWLQLAEIVAEELNSGATGVIIPHGTDTMAYTAAALSFLLPELPGPVILVGSQRSSDRPSSDATMNLLAAARLTQTDLGEVVIAMHETISDTVVAVHRGTRARKMHTSRRDAFRSINSPILAEVEGDNINFLGDYRKRSNGPAIVSGPLDEDVRLVYSYPGLTPDVFARMVEGASGVVIAGTGLGHVSSALLGKLEEMREKGVPVVMTSQCINGSVNMNVYSTGRQIMKAGVIPAGDMLPEAAFIKLMWALGRTSDTAEIREIMLTPMAGETSDRRVE